MAPVGAGAPTFDLPASFSHNAFITFKGQGPCRGTVNLALHQPGMSAIRQFRLAGDCVTLSGVPHDIQIISPMTWNKQHGILARV